MSEKIKNFVDMENFGFLQGRINENEKKIKALEEKNDFKTENCPHYVTGCFHVLEQNKIIETGKTHQNNLNYQNKELFEKLKEMTADAKCYRERNQEALKVYEKFKKEDMFAIESLIEIEKKLKGIE